MAELDLETVLDAWFRREIDRAHALFAGNDYAAAIRPAGLDEIEARKFDRSVVLGDAESNLERLRAELDAGVFAAGRPTARAIAPRVTPSISESTPEFTALCRRVTELLGEVEEARARWASGDVGYRPPLIPSSGCDVDGPASAPTTATPPPAAPPVDDAASSPLREAIGRRIAKYRRDYQPTDRLLRQVTSELELLASAFGGDRRVDSVTPAMMRRLCAAIQYLPPQWRSNKALGSGNVLERAGIAQGMDLLRLNKITVKGHMTQWRILFDDEGVIPNPVTGIVIRVPRARGAARDKGFTAKEIEQIFNSPLFQGAESVELPYQHGKTLIDNWQFWACLVACFTGARISEIAQLRPQDVFEKADGAAKVWAIRITEESNEPGVTRRLKNRQSNRDVPVHQELVRIGLLRLAQAQKAVGASTLLPGCPKPVGKDPGKQLSKWMSEKFLHRLAIKRDGMGFHFFRHSLTTWLRDADVPKDARDVLTGHSRSNGESDGDYGTWSIATLHRHLHGIAVPAAIRSIASRRT